MFDLIEADPLTAELILTCNHYQVSTEYKRAALRAAAKTIDAMAAVEADLDRGQWITRNV